MRKLVAISLLLIYIVSTLVVAVRAHYINGKLESINLILDRNAAKSEPIKKRIVKVRCKETSPKCISCEKVIIHKNKPTAVKHDPIREVLNCADALSNGFIKACDDADAETTPVICNTQQGFSRKFSQP